MPCRFNFISFQHYCDSEIFTQWGCRNRFCWEIARICQWNMSNKLFRRQRVFLAKLKSRQSVLFSLIVACLLISIIESQHNKITSCSWDFLNQHISECGTKQESKSASSSLWWSIIEDVRKDVAITTRKLSANIYSFSPLAFFVYSTSFSKLFVERRSRSVSADTRKGCQNSRGSCHCGCSWGCCHHVLSLNQFTMFIISLSSVILLQDAMARSPWYYDWPIRCEGPPGHHPLPAKKRWQWQQPGL